jgi:hypothetical protein
VSVINLKKLLKPKAKKALDPLAQKVDRLGELKAILDPVKPVQDEYEKLKKEVIAEVTPLGDPGVDIVVSGDIHCLVLGPRSNERSVADPAALYEALGHAAFLAVVKPALAELDKRLTADQQAKLIVVVPGNRKQKALVPVSPAA